MVVASSVAVGDASSVVVVACAVEVVVVSPIEPFQATTPQKSTNVASGGGDDALPEGGDAAAAGNEGGVHANRLGAAAEIALGGP